MDVITGDRGFSGYRELDAAVAEPLELEVIYAVRVVGNESLDRVCRAFGEYVSPTVERMRIVAVEKKVGARLCELFADVGLDLLVTVFVCFFDPLLYRVISLEHDAVTSQTLGRNLRQSFAEP